MRLHLNHGRSVVLSLGLVTSCASSASSTSADGAGGAGGSPPSQGGSSDGGNGGNVPASTGGEPVGVAGGTAGGEPVGVVGGTAGGGEPEGGAGTAGGGEPEGGAGTTGVAGAGAGPEQPGECGAVTTFADGLTPAGEIHVSMDGHDGNDGSLENPVASLERGIELAVPGTAVRIHTGTYAGGAFVSGLSGNADAPIWIGGAPGETPPVIEGGTDAMHLVQPRYVVIHDLEIQGQEANGMNVDDGDDRANEDAARFVVFQNLFIHDVGSDGNQDCLKLSGLNDYFVLDSRFERCGGGGSAVDHVGCHRGLLTRNLVQELGGNGIQSKGGSDDIEIRGNLFKNAGERAVNMGGSTGFEFFRPPLTEGAPNFEARNIRAVANVFVGSVAPINFVGCVDCLAANNTIIDPERWVVRILQETVTDAGYEFLPSQGGRFVNNLVSYSRGVISTHVNVGENTDPESFVFQKNLWYASDAPEQSTPDLPVAESDGTYGEDPALSAPSSDDFSIPENSPAAGAGEPLGELTQDFVGACYLDPPSIGALER